jgi:hypothetical protein
LLPYLKYLTCENASSYIRNGSETDETGDIVDTGGDFGGFDGGGFGNFTWNFITLKTSIFYTCFMP